MSSKDIFQYIKKPDSSSKNAYVLSVFKNPRYMLGAIVTAYSIKYTDTKHNIVLMITEDIISSWVQLAQKIFDEIVVVPYLQAYTINMRTQKQQVMYQSWKNVSFTKWNCLGLNHYEKVLFIDSDKVILENIDHLFNLSAPAGTFSSPFAQGYSKGRGGIPNPYRYIVHGEKIDQKIVDKSMENSFVVIGTCILLQPDMEKYNNIAKHLQSYTEENPFGFLNCNSMTDEQFICTIERDWTYISQKYNWIMWHPQWLRRNEFPPAVIHYFSTKPWDMKRDEWPDLQIWWDFAIQMIQNVYSNDEDVIKLYREDEYKKVDFGCPYCKILNQTSNTHRFIKEGKITCPLYKKL